MTYINIVTLHGAGVSFDDLAGRNWCNAVTPAIRVVKREGPDCLRFGGARLFRWEWATNFWVTGSTLEIEFDLIALLGLEG